MICVGTHIALWIAGRLLQGASAAVVYTVGMALLIETVSKKDLAQAMGYVDLASTIGVCAGPLLGGVLYERCGYYAPFGLAFGLITLDIVLRLALIERKHALRWTQPQLPSTRSEKTMEENITPGQPENPEEKTRRNRLVTLLSSYRMIVAIWVSFVVSIVLTSFDSTIPLFVRDTFHWKQTAQGLIFIPLAIPHLFDPLIGFLVDRYGFVRRYVAAGALLASVPPIVLLRAVTENTMHDKIILCALLALIGLCLALLAPPIMVEVFYTIQAKEEEDPRIFGTGGAIAFSYGLMNAAFAAGSIAGPFFGGFIKDDAGWGTMGWAIALLMGVSVVPTLLCLGGLWTKRSI
ncbi:hypothetical protein ASPWEDRAFT_37896 [Aspergillus wentii DTO 134E9]|uniref:Major facilitator superfamily (MFS) profile domain-containing protein n=1 Tax=Aspergillus wentii DTO 134E9 TaxID=1073089 RepID=A0A1L9RN57_ASPWE|nr:uncharacterized protein ASPWEDRAFT_37896 [Aspergillus wentii DTO 134E9]OJJ36323.1 hypothetical protein ASPWEDRAFT_37896 [Aspergillus wentii DTO 134E9]